MVCIGQNQQAQGIPMGSIPWLSASWASLTEARASVSLSRETRRWLLYTPNRCDTAMLVRILCLKEKMR